MCMFKRIMTLFTLAVLVSGCMTGRVMQKVEDKAQINRIGPRELPVRNITDFRSSLRCMDNLILDFGFAKGSYSILIENIRDRTDKVKAGAKEMLISSIVDMTRRSQVVELVVYGDDAGNLISILDRSGHVYKMPSLAIGGAVTYLDKDIVREQEDLSGQLSGSVDGTSVGGGAGMSASGGASVLGMDLYIMTSHNLGVIPGVMAKNSVVIYNSGNAKDFDMGISKTGVNYSVSSNEGDGTAQALRAVAELSAIELVGKLLKVPYWKCLGLDSEHEDIREEITDWYYELERNNLIDPLVRAQLFVRGYYRGGLGDEFGESYNDAVIAYKSRLGLETLPGADLAFYTAFLNSTPDFVDPTALAYLRKRNSESKITDTKEILQAQTESFHLEINPDYPNGYRIGEFVNLEIKSNTNGYVSCFMQGLEGIQRIFPNRFSPDGFISNKGSINLPGSADYLITTDHEGEAILCLLTTSAIDTLLPAALKEHDFEWLSVNSFDEIKLAYETATRGRFAATTYRLEVKK